MSAQAVRPDRVALADIVREHAGQLTGLSPTQQQGLRVIAHCRRAALGGHRRECPQCGHQEISSTSCRDRHCPKCQGLEAARWLVSLHDGQVTFRWTDRAHGNAPRCATLEAEAFLRRVLLHVLPDRFVRIRHDGWLANSARKRLLPKVREVLLGPSATVAP